MEIFIKSLEEMEEFNKIIDENDAMQLPLVSICSITYNHAPYIRQCLDGFLMQKTKFKYEIIIHDDASTDGTAEIIKEYAEKYPDLITPIFQTENQYSKGLRGFYARFVFPKAKGKYIAMCEGDDYWTDPLKLQKQVDFLEANPDFVMCSHKFLYFIENTQSYDKFYDIDNDLFFDLNSYISKTNWVTQPLTIMFRHSCLDVEEYLKYRNSKDVSLFYYILKSGKGLFFNETMGIYRVHDGGIWQGTNRCLRIKADLETVLGIYEIEKDFLSSNFIKNSMINQGYLGVSFLRRNFVLYLKCIYAIYCHSGLKSALGTIYKTINYFAK